MRIEFSPKARQHLLAITDYYAEWGGIRSVERLLEKIVEKQQRILKYPESYHQEPLLTDRKVVYRSVIINDYYKMIYRLDDDVITISAFWDMRMNPKKLRRMI
jgi:plasmid stabilization system protein ParE